MPPAPDTIPTTVPLDLPRTSLLPWAGLSRQDRTLAMLRDARTALAGALQELTTRHPHDPALRAQVQAWHLQGGVPFRP